MSIKAHFPLTVTQFASTFNRDERAGAFAKYGSSGIASVVSRLYLPLLLSPPPPVNAPLSFETRNGGRAISTALSEQLYSVLFII